MPGKVVVLAGGVGAARFLEGLVAVIPAEDIIVIGNTGDDLEVHGLHVSPDLDTVTYTLAGIAGPRSGLGSRGRHIRMPGSLGKTRQRDLVPAR